MRMSKSQTPRTAERAKPARPASEPPSHETVRVVPQPPRKRRGLLIASLVLLAAWALFLLGLAIFGS